MGRNETYYDAEGRIIIRPYLLKDLANIFGFHPQTLKSRMAPYPELAQKDGKYFSIRQVEFIGQKLGWPHKLYVNQKV